MTVNAINGTLLSALSSALSAVDGVALSTLSAINGQTLDVGVPDLGDIVFMDSADIQPTSGTASWWDGTTGSGMAITSGVSEAHDRVWQSVSGGRQIKTLPSAYATPSGRARFRITADVGKGIFRLYTAGDEHLSVEYVAGGNFRYVRGSTQIAISTGGHISLNHWYEIEAALVIHDTTGTVTGNLYDSEGAGAGDLLESLAFGPGDTKDGSSTTASTSLFGAADQIEDLVIDSTGELYGPSRIEVLAPTGAGNYSQLIRGGTDSGANWSQVNEVPVQIGGGGDDYNDSTGSNQRDSYMVANRSITGTPRCVGLHGVCQRILGSPTFKLFLRIGGVDYDGATTFTATSSNVFFSQFWQNNPATGNAWTDTDINSAEFGILAIDTNLRMRSLLVQVLVQL